MNKSNLYEAKLNELEAIAKTDWDFERLELALKESLARVSNKRFKLRQEEFKKKMGGK